MHVVFLSSPRSARIGFGGVDVSENPVIDCASPSESKLQGLAMAAARPWDGSPKAAARARIYGWIIVRASTYAAESIHRQPQ